MRQLRNLHRSWNKEIIFFCLINVTRVKVQIQKKTMIIIRIFVLMIEKCTFINYRYVRLFCSNRHQHTLCVLHIIN